MYYKFFIDPQLNWGFFLPFRRQKNKRAFLNRGKPFFDALLLFSCLIIFIVAGLCAK